MNYLNEVDSREVDFNMNYMSESNLVVDAFVKKNFSEDIGSDYLEMEFDVDSKVGENYLINCFLTPYGKMCAPRKLSPSAEKIFGKRIKVEVDLDTLESLIQ